MYPEEGILTRPKKPDGPLTKAAIAGAGIMAGVPATDPDTDGRRSYSPGYGEAFANRGGSSSPSGPDSTALTPIAQGIAAPSPQARPEAIPVAAEQGMSSVTHGASPNQPQGIAAPPVGRNDQGIITADSAQVAYGNDMQRSGGIFGTMDMAGVNGIMARENKARGEMIDSMIKSNGGNGIAVLPDYAPPASNGMSINDIQSAMKSAGTRTERAAYGQALNQAIAGQNQQASDAVRQQGILAGLDVKSRGQDVGLQRAQDRNDVTARGQDVRAETSANRIASNEAIAGARIAERSSQAGRLTLPQSRSNFEIDSARKAVAGMSPEEIKRKTANFTATGRENPEYDPSMAKAVSLSNRRKYGTDDEFDARQEAQQPAGTDGDVTTRFRADKAMQGHKTGNMTENGVEVFDASGRLIGHYR